MRVLAPVLLVFSVFAGLVLAQGTKAQQSSAQRLNPDQLLNSAIDAQQRGDYQTAIREYRKLLELRPNMVEAKVNLGAALVHVGDFDSAIAMYRSALPSIPQKSAVLLNLALAYYKRRFSPRQ